MLILKFFDNNTGIVTTKAESITHRIIYFSVLCLIKGQI